MPLAPTLWPSRSRLRQISTITTEKADGTMSPLPNSAGQLPAWPCSPGQPGCSHGDRNTDSASLSDPLLDNYWSLSGCVYRDVRGIHFAHFRIGMGNPIVNSSVYVFGVFLFCLLGYKLQLIYLGNIELKIQSCIVHQSIFGTHTYLSEPLVPISVKLYADASLYKLC